MNKLKIGSIIFVILYLAAGIIYHSKMNACENARLASKAELTSTETENSGSNPIGLAVTTLFWPVFLTTDKIYNEGVFDCKK